MHFRFPIFYYPHRLFVSAHHPANDPLKPQKQVNDRPVFFTASFGPDMYEKLNTETRELVHRDNPFTRPEEIGKHLETTVYTFDHEPNLIRLPQQRGEIVQQIPNALTTLSDQLMGQFLGNAYSFSGEFMAGVGEGINAESMRRNFPKAYAALTAPDGPLKTYRDGDYVGGVRMEEGDLYLRRENEGWAKQLFRNNVTEEDLPKIAAVLDGKDAQTWTARLIEDNWNKFAESYDGLTYTDGYTDLTGKFEKTWKTAKISDAYAKTHARSLGTIGKLLHSHDLAWPGKKPHAAARAFHAAANVFTKYGRERNADQSRFNKAVKTAKQRVFG